MYYRRLKLLRTYYDYKQKSIADLLGTSQRQYSRWETGDSEIPAHHLVTLAKFYHTSVDYILGLTGDDDTIYRNDNGRQ